MPPPPTSRYPGSPPRGLRQASLNLVEDEQHYEQILQELLPNARVAVWIATANLKELRLPAPIGTRARASRRGLSSVVLLAELAQRGIEVKILHSRPPSLAFQRALAALDPQPEKLMLRCCPRTHMKLVIVDGRFLYLGSANFTGAGLGARGAKRRNFEVGILTEDDYLLDRCQDRFDHLWRGRPCGPCGLRGACPQPIDSLVR